MAEPTIPLFATHVEPDDPIVGAISRWNFPDLFVSRLLTTDIPQRATHGNCRLFIYSDPNRQIVGFGTIDLCDDYRDLTGGKAHYYLPLLAVHPEHLRKGHGISILNHLVGEAAIGARQPTASCFHTLFLDVYLSSKAAIELYRRSEFVQIGPEQFDTIENKPYIVMAKRLI